MNSPHLNFHDEELRGLDATDRWSAYYRLRELSIPCDCSPYCPLKVRVQTATDIAQVWSVVKQIGASRQERLDWLERCWELDARS